MVKKRINKKVVKTKSLNFKIPDSFNEIGFKNKIISIILIALVIGVIGSLFPGDNITGMTTFQNAFEPLKGLIISVNEFITWIFGQFFPGENEQPLIIYARFLLFALVISIVYFIMTIIGSSNPLLNFLVGCTIAYLSTFFIPMDAILATGILYSSTFMLVLLLVPFLILGFIYFKLPKTRPGYILRCALLIIMHVLIISQINISAENFFYIDIVNNIGSIFLVVIWIFLIYSFIKIFTVGTLEAATSAAIKRGKPVVEAKMNELFARIFRKMSKSGGFTRGGGI